MLRNKIAIEFLNILKYETESTIDEFIPLKKNKENGLERNTCQKKLKKKIVYKQAIWMVCRRTRKDEEYSNYKKYLNAAVTEIRQSKRTYEQKEACNIYHDSKSCMHMSEVNKT